MASVASDRPLPGVAGAPTESFREATAELREAAFRRAVDGPGVHILAPLLRGRLAMRPQTVDLAADVLARETAHTLLTHGWTPGELHSFASRRLDEASLSYLTDTLAAAAQVTIAPPWYGELAELGAHVWWSVNQPHLAQWAARHAHRRVESIRAAVEVLALLCHVPRTDDPLPGSPQQLGIARGALVHDKRIAGKIDALLARAADPTYPAEAQACATKAQELMVRYATVPDVAEPGPVSRTAAAAVDQLLREGPLIAAKTLFAGVRAGTSMGLTIVADPKRFAGNVTDDVTAILQRAAALIANLSPSLPALPGRGGRRELEG